MKYIRLWIILAATLGSILLFACGGDDDDNNDNGPTATTSSDGANETPEATDDQGASGNSGDELRDLAAGLAEHEAKIAYDFSSSAGGTSSSGSFTLYWKPPDTWRVDIDMDGSQSTLISREGKSYICSSDGGTGQCIESPVAAPLPFLGLFTNPSSLADLVDTELGGIDFDKSSEQIAGQDATCYSASGSVQGQAGSAEYCFNDDGLLLRLDGGSAGATFTLEATNVEGSVADADLELPYDILQIPGQ